MASDQPEPSPFIENLINSRNRDISLFLPFILGLNAAGPLRQTENPGSPSDRIVFINPFTQGMVVIERSSSSGDNNSTNESAFDSLLNELHSSKSGRPPASKASIDALESVEVDGADQCVICLEEWEEAGEKAKQMPCKHRFHGGCIDKWLNIHGSCPVCRYEMPVDESDDEKKTRSGGERRREIWVSFMFGGERRSGERDHSVSSDRRSGDQETGDREM